MRRVMHSYFTPKQMEAWRPFVVEAVKELLDAAEAKGEMDVMRGKVLRKDDRVRWFISSANRDPDAFDEPDSFDIARHPNQHVAFGSGTHHCLGATLARVEGQEVFKALAERFPRLRVKADRLDYQPSITFRSLKSLPVVLH
jgi:cytochrome P450